MKLSAWLSLFLVILLGLGAFACTSSGELETAASTSPTPLSRSGQAVAQQTIITPTALPTATAMPTAVVQADPPESCSITQPLTPNFVPPAPYSEQPPNGEFWYGSNELWTALQPEGIWRSLPKSEEGYVNKVVWFREGYVWTEEPEPEIAMSARQLDGDGVVEKFVHGTNGYHPDYESFMLTGIALPALGCWEITGEYNGHTLSFVVWVAP